MKTTHACLVVTLAVLCYTDAFFFNYMELKRLLKIVDPKTCGCRLPPDCKIPIPNAEYVGLRCHEPDTQICCRKRVPGAPVARFDPANLRQFMSENPGILKQVSVNGPGSFLLRKAIGDVPLEEITTSTTTTSTSTTTSTTTTTTASPPTTPVATSTTAAGAPTTRIYNPETFTWRPVKRIPSFPRRKMVKDRCRCVRTSECPEELMDLAFKAFCGYDTVRCCEESATTTASPPVTTTTEKEPEEELLPTIVIARPAIQQRMGQEEAEGENHSNSSDQMLKHKIFLRYEKVQKEQEEEEAENTFLGQLFLFLSEAGDSFMQTLQGLIS